MILPFKLRRIGKLDLLISEIQGSGEVESGARMVVTTRRSGVSFHRGDLNLSFGTGDRREAVVDNREALFGSLGISATQVAGLRQRHTALVVDATEENWLQLVRRELDGDAMITRLRGHWLSVSVGDCLAIVVYDPGKGVLALVHAGWAGTAKRIAERAVTRMITDYGCRPSDLRAVLCPCVHRTSYQVDEPVFELFQAHWQGWERFVSDCRDGRGYLDIPSANRNLLLEAGVPPEQISDFGLCTAALPALFFSHRRDGLPSGRMMVLACLV